MSITFIHGDASERTRELPSEYFDCIVTSPPYWGLRDYGCEGQIGLEPTLDEYLETLVSICRELRRVLKPSGVFFLNIGDSYATPPGGAGHQGKTGQRASRRFTAAGSSRKGVPTGLKPKDLCLVPERIGIALQSDGWWVRSHIIWHKLNPMPESVTDRPTSAHETVWMLTKSEQYFWNAVGSKEETTTAFRNIRNVWGIATHPFHGVHFATMPTEIVERCIKAGCPACGRVLDPFAGAGTTGLVADRLGRDSTLIELNQDYIEMAKHRIHHDAPLLVDVVA